MLVAIMKKVFGYIIKRKFLIDFITKVRKNEVETLHEISHVIQFKI